MIVDQHKIVYSNRTYEALNTQCKLFIFNMRMGLEPNVNVWLDTFLGTLFTHTLVFTKLK